jgi:hypothetical protein
MASKKGNTPMKISQEFTPNISHICHFPILRHPRKISDILKKKLSAKLP